MIEITEDEWKSNQEKFRPQLENGEDFLIRKTDGTAYIATDISKFDQRPLCDI
jgi:hypothetical protein